MKCAISILPRGALFSVSLFDLERSMSYTSPSKENHSPQRSGYEAQVEAGNRLFQKGQQLLRKLEAKRQERPEGCTFTPTVTHKARSCTTPKSEDRFNKLFSDGKKIKDKRQQEKESSATKGCTFKPEISKKSQKINNNKLKGKDRLHNLYRDGEKTRKKLEQKREDSATAGCTFTPKINKSRRKSVGSASSRLYEPTKDIKDLEEKKIAKELEGCTFQPKISARSKSTPRTRQSMASGDGSIYDRLYAFGKENREQREKIAKDAVEKKMSMFTFKPDIGNDAEGRTPPRPSTSEPIHERLYQQGRKEDILQNLRGLQEKLDEELTFKPQINFRSQSVGKLRPSMSASIFERLHSEHAVNQEQIERNEELKVSKELEGCTYRPYISERSRSVGRMHSKDDGDIFDRLYPKPHDEEEDEENVIVTKV